MIRIRTGRAAAVLTIAISVPGAALAQAPNHHTAEERRDHAPPGSFEAIHRPPASYGTAYGSPSYGVPRTYSNFASPFGGYGYSNGPAPFGLVPGPYGAQLWRPGFVEPGYFYARNIYWTYPLPRGSVWPAPGVPVGYYAPSLGPPMFVRP